jgi:hypothetical protein
MTLVIPQVDAKSACYFVVTVTAVSLIIAIPAGINV